MPKEDPYSLPSLEDPIYVHIKFLYRMTLEGKLSNNVAPIQSLTLDDHYLVAGSRDRNVRVSLFT